MMRRRRNPENLWLLLALPIIGAIGWIASRFIGSQKANRQETIPVSGPRPAVDQKEWFTEPQPSTRPQDAGWKETENETKISQSHQEAGETKQEAAKKTGHALENQPERLSLFLVLLVPFLILPVAIVLLAFYHLPVQSQAVVPGGDPKRGQVDLQAWGCGSCHTIQGVTGADGRVGPALNDLSKRSYIAGHLQNIPDNMVQWIMHPQEISPGVDMPDSAVPVNVARDMAAYLYSIK